MWLKMWKKTLKDVSPNIADRWQIDYKKVICYTKYNMSLGNWKLK